MSRLPFIRSLFVCVSWGAVLAVSDPADVQGAPPQDTQSGREWTAGPGGGRQGEPRNLERDTAVLRWLDKATARVQTIEVSVNQTTRIETLEIIVRACRERPPEEPPESAAFLDVWEIKPGEAAAEVFRGWMFASSPAVSAMEHPVYDLWVLDCKDSRADAGGDGGAKSRPN